MPLEDSLALLDYPFARAHWRNIARAFNKPLLYVVTPQFEAQAGNLKKNRPRTQVEVFKKAGHALFVDEPERFNALIEQFAKKVLPVDGSGRPPVAPTANSMNCASGRALCRGER